MNKGRINWNRWVIPIAACFAVAFIVSCTGKTCKTQQSTVKTFSIAEPVVEIFAVDPILEALFNPMPLRVGTEGALIYHRPFCPYAQRSLDMHGAVKRINWFSIDEIPGNRTPDQFCLAGAFECPEDPAVFAAGDGLCQIDRRYGEIPTIDPANTVCFWHGYTLLVVDAANCDSGTIITTDGDPVDIDFVYLNAIPNAIGDANGDGDITEADFEYLVACYTDEGISSSLNCQACFDYDEDGDVDLRDFQTFIGDLDTGNSAWVNSNYPDASQLISRDIPLRVGMIGSDLYHREGCRYVENSRATYGTHLYIEFYTREQIESSGRQPNIVGGPECDATLQEWEY